MTTKLGISGNEKLLPEPDSPVSITNGLIGSSRRVADGTLKVDYITRKRSWAMRWSELTEAQTLGTDGVVTEAIRASDLQFLPPDSGKTLDDEQGATLVALSLEVGQSFLRADSLDLSTWAGTEGSDTPYMMTVTDSAGKFARAFVGAAGIILTVNDLASNGGFEDPGGGGADIWDVWVETASDGALANETSIKHAGNDSAKITAGASIDTRVGQTIATAVGKLHNLSLQSRGDGTYSGRFRVWDNSNSAWITAMIDTGVTGTSFAGSEQIFAAPAGCTSIIVYLYCPATDTGIAYFDTVVVNEITAPGFGLNAISALNGSTQTWQVIQSGFDYNDSSFTFEIHKPFVTVAGGDSDITYDLVDTSPIRYSVSLSLREV